MKRDSPFTGGKFSHAQINWIRDTLAWGIKQNKVMLAVMHHGVVEHYNSQKKHFRDYLVRSNVQVARILASGKVPLVFTGHYHAQDIALTKFKNGTYLYDVETGSLVTYPDPLRLVTLESSGKAVISSFNVTEIPSFTAAGRDFADYSKSNVRSGINGIAVATMIKFGMKEPEAAMLAPQITEAFIAHYSGDERFTGKEMLATGGLSFMGGLVVGNRKDLVYGLWQDSEPPDNSLIIDFTSGSWFSP
ncbi:MAG: hypothetical protein E4H36_04915 [Spirochaetales bacterium]|nr:MAG: hypothetical protein E4H36_04915 [Spirochaetales bacterium]